MRARAVVLAVLATVVLTLIALSARAATPSGSGDREEEHAVESRRTPPAAEGASSSRPYVLGVEDVIEVDVWKNPELSQEQAVRPDGRIAFKLVGEVDVEGLTIEQLRTRLTELYREYVPAAEVSVVVKEINSFKVYILGRIEKPGEYKVTSGLTMLQVLALAGPFLPYANVKDIKVFRRTPTGDRVLAFNYRDVVRGLAGDMDLFPGDRVLVP